MATLCRVCVPTGFSRAAGEWKGGALTGFRMAVEKFLDCELTQGPAMLWESALFTHTGRPQVEGRRMS